MSETPKFIYESPDPLERFRDNLNATWQVGAVIENDEITFQIPSTDIRFKRIEEQFGEAFDITTTSREPLDEIEKGLYVVYLVKMKRKEA